jgi:hypothetical protein
MVLVGAGTRLLSGMSYYTMRLAGALASRYPFASVPMR